MNIVHVNQHVIKHNAKHGTSYPALTVKLDAATQRLLDLPATVYCHEVAGLGRIVDSTARGRNPLSCGARVWMEYPDPIAFSLVGPVLTWAELRARLYMAAEATSDLCKALAA